MLLACLLGSRCVLWTISLMGPYETLCHVSFFIMPMCSSGTWIHLGITVARQSRVSWRLAGQGLVEACRPWGQSGSLISCFTEARRPRTHCGAGLHDGLSRRDFTGLIGSSLHGGSSAHGFRVVFRDGASLCSLDRRFAGLACTKYCEARRVEAR